MRRLALVAAILAGCATPRSAFPPIANMHSPTLCYVRYAGNVAEIQAAGAELDARRFQCTDAAVAEGRQQWQSMAEGQRQLDSQHARGPGADAALGLGLILLAQPPAPRGPVVCNTTPNGQTTVCR